MHKDIKDFLDQYPLTPHFVEMVDQANNGKTVPLLRYLCGALQAITKLKCIDPVIKLRNSQGLVNYYRGMMHALILNVENKDLRKSLTSIFIGE